ncbi:MAG: lipoate--protein ligase family protein [Desulfobacteraceae bacterium]|nr:MAG: lipoate--protein ligase family protein [Desulfobacteraceae bacterium]
MNGPRKEIRVLDFPGVDGFTGLGLRQVLMESVGDGRSLPTYATVDYRRPFISIGPSQDIDSVIDVERCTAAKVDIVRRSSASGGAIFYDGGMSEYLVVPREFFPGIDDVFEYCRRLFAHVASKFDYPEIQYVGNDMRWCGRKVGAFAAITTERAYMAISFFNLRRPDMDLYMRFARSPMEKFSDKEVKDPRSYLATPEDLVHHPLSYAEVRGVFRDGVRELLGIEPVPGVLSDKEEERLQRVTKEMREDGWVFRYSSSRRFAAIPRGCLYGVGFFKGKKLIQVNAILDREGKRIEDIMISGDHMISPPSVVDLMSSSIRGLKSDDESEILGALSRILADPRVEQPKAGALSPEDFLQAIRVARQNAVICHRS